MALTVRPLEASDHGPWEAMFRAYIAFYGASVPDDVIAYTWQRIVGRPSEIHGLVACDRAGQPVGFALSIFHASTWSATSYCYLEDLFVVPAARGTGAGRALIDAVYAEADRRGATRTYWVTETDNVVARRLYDRLAKVAPFVQYRR